MSETNIEEKEHELLRHVAGIRANQLGALQALIGPLRDFLQMEADIQKLLGELAALKKGGEE